MSVISSPYAVKFKKAIDQERRVLGERRQFDRHTLIRNCTLHRRRNIRRTSDKDLAHVDWYERRLFVITIGVVILSALDATFTLNLLQMGSLELNPVMAVLIEYNTELFVGTKLALTGIGVVVLVALSNFRLFRWLKVSYILSAILFTYAMLTAYEFGLYRHAIGLNM